MVFTTRAARALARSGPYFRSLFERFLSFLGVALLQNAIFTTRAARALATRAARALVPRLLILYVREMIHGDN